MDFNGLFLLLHKITQKKDVFLKTICYPGPPSQACRLERFPNYPQSTIVSATGMTTSFNCLRSCRLLSENKACTQSTFYGHDSSSFENKWYIETMLCYIKQPIWHWSSITPKHSQVHFPPLQLDILEVQ